MSTERHCKDRDDRVLMVIAVLLGLGIGSYSFWLAFAPIHHHRFHAVPTDIKPRTITDTSTRVELRDFPLSNFGGGPITTGIVTDIAPITS